MMTEVNLCGHISYRFQHSNQQRIVDMIINGFSIRFSLLHVIQLPMDIRTSNQNRQYFCVRHSGPVILMVIKIQKCISTEQTYDFRSVNFYGWVKKNENIYIPSPSHRFSLRWQWTNHLKYSAYDSVHQVFIMVQHSTVEDNTGHMACDQRALTSKWTWIQG